VGAVLVELTGGRGAVLVELGELAIAGAAMFTAPSVGELADGQGIGKTWSKTATWTTTI